MCAGLTGTSSSDGYSPGGTTGDTPEGHVRAVAPVICLLLCVGAIGVLSGPSLLTNLYSLDKEIIPSSTVCESPDLKLMEH